MSDTDRFNEQASSETEAGKASPNEELLKEIRKNFAFHRDYWKPIHEEAAIDMTFVAGDGWTEDEKRERSGRPCLAPDEISQYLKQANNNVRQNKRAIKVIPKGEGSSDDDAEKRGAIIRGIEHASNAQSAYTSGFEGSTSGGFGFWRLTTQIMPGGNGFDVEPRIKRIPNPFTVLMDPQAKEADFSDQKRCFAIDLIRRDDFKVRYPKANKTSFTAADMKLAPDWFPGDDNIILAEYWCVEEKTRKKVKVKRGENTETDYEDQLKGGESAVDDDHRSITERTVTQYITNGIEILETNKWPGSWIPIIACMGEEIYTNDAGKSKRMFLSLVRRARVPQKMLNYIASQEAEEFGQAPRAPYMIYEGQELADKKAWETINKIPRPYIKIKPVQGPNGETLPPPQRQPFVPNIQAYQVARESWRRSIQAAMSGSPLPTSAQRQNEKSGVALEKIENNEAIGSYHFTDNLDRALENTGRQLNELITRVMDTPRTVGIRNPDDTHGTMKVMAASQEAEHAPQPPMQPMQGMPQPGMPQPGTPQQPQVAPQPDASKYDYLITDRGEFDVTISTGPSFQSQREQASEFADTLLKEVEPLAQLLPQGAVAKLLSQAIKLKGLGHIGDEMADVIAPADNTGQQLAQAQQALAQGQKQMQEMQQELQKLQLEKAGKVIQGETAKQLQTMKNDIDVLKALLQSKQDHTAQEQEMYMQFWKENHGAAHEIAMQKDQQAHDAQQNQLAAQQATQSQAADHANQQTLAEQQAQQSEGQ